MHYPCAGGGHPQLTFSSVDKTGHHCVYDPAAKSDPACLAHPPAGAADADKASLGVSFERGLVARNIFETLSILDSAGVLPKREYALKDGESPDTVYRGLIAAPNGFSHELDALFAQLNPTLKPNRLKNGADILVPAIR